VLRIDDLLPRAVVHPIEVGGGENISRRSLLDLFHQSRACGIARSHFDAGAFRERSINVVKRVLHGGSGKDGNTFVLARCEVGPEDCEKCENDRGKPADPAHSVPPKRFTTRMSARSDHQSFW